MDVLDAIGTRRSIREFTEQKVSKETVEILLENGILAPSASNSQPWTFVVIQDSALLKEYSDRGKALYLEMMKDHPDPHDYKTRLADPNFNIFYNASTLILIYNKSHRSLGVGDCSLAAQNIMLTAHSLGLGTCWIGFSLPLFNDAQFKQELGIPAKYQAVAPLIVGYPAISPDPTPRKSPEILVWK